ncbi:MAG: Arc family DNA-binding protein [Deltaproteobacteria bacterium]|nr:Arc family DNA-binding protein [Deltaproteobacteria bacterium]
MTSITIRQLPDDLKQRLRVRAANNGRSMESEAREILARALAPDLPAAPGLGTQIRALFADIGGADLDMPLRESPRDPPEFS